MNMKYIRWRPDTCGCELLICKPIGDGDEIDSWQIAPGSIKDVDGTTVPPVPKRCPAHQHLSNAAVYDAIRGPHGENRRASDIGTVVSEELLEDVDEPILDSDPITGRMVPRLDAAGAVVTERVRRLPNDVDIVATFEGTGNRKMTITVVGRPLSQGAKRRIDQKLVAGPHDEDQVTVRDTRQ